MPLLDKNSFSTHFTHFFLQDHMPESNPVQLLQTVYPSELLGSTKLFEEVRIEGYYCLSGNVCMSLRI